MDPLHRGDHAEPAEARDVVGMQVLGMLNPPAEIALVRMLLEDLFKQIERFAVGPIPDRVHAKLEAMLGGQPGGAAKRAHRRGVQPGAFRQIVVGLQEPRPVRAQGPVDESLDGSHREVMVAEAQDAIFRQALGQGVVRFADHHPKPHF